MLVWRDTARLFQKMCAISRMLNMFQQLMVPIHQIVTGHRPDLALTPFGRGVPGGGHAIPTGPLVRSSCGRTAVALRRIENDVFPSGKYRFLGLGRAWARPQPTASLPKA